MKYRHYNEPKTIENDRRTLADHLVSVHGANKLAAYAARDRMLEDVHADYHKAEAKR